MNNKKIIENVKTTKKVVDRSSLSSLSLKKGIIDEQTTFSIAEAYRNLRTNLFFSVPGREKCNKIIFTSSVSNEGKTTTCINLAITVAQAENRVLLIDCDLRKPRIDRYLELKMQKGLSDYLCGQSKAEDIVYDTNHANLKVIPAGIIPPNPSELLSRKELKELLDKIEGSYDFIFFDVPPLDTVSDALILVPFAEGVIYVVKNKITAHPTLQKNIKKLEFANAKIFGLVLNGAKSENLYGSYYYYQENK